MVCQLTRTGPPVAAADAFVFEDHPQQASAHVSCFVVAFARRSCLVANSRDELVESHQARRSLRGRQPGK